MSLWNFLLGWLWPGRAATGPSRVATADPAAETAGATVLVVTAAMGMPVSTTHVITTAIIGVGAAKRMNALKWSVVERIVWAWILTLPATAGVGYLLLRLMQLAGWVS